MNLILHIIGILQDVAEARFCSYPFIEKDKEMQHTQQNLKYFEVDALQEWFQMYSGKQLAQSASHRVIMSYICDSVYSTTW